MCQKRTKRRTKAAQTGQKKGAPNEGGRPRRGGDSVETRLTVESGQQSGQATGKGSASEKSKPKQSRYKGETCSQNAARCLGLKLPLVACPKVTHTYSLSLSVYLPLSVPPSPTLAGHVRLICKTHVCRGSKGPPAAVHCRTGYTLAQRTLRSVCSGHR